VPGAPRIVPGWDRGRERPASAVVGIAVVVSAVALMFVAPGLAVLLVLLAVPAAFAASRGGGFEAVFAGIGLAFLVLVATSAAFFVTCLAVAGSGPDSNAAFPVAVLVAGVVAASLGAWIVAVAIRRGRRRRRNEDHWLARRLDRAFGDDPEPPEPRP
jgi:hypothetical protein